MALMEMMRLVLAMLILQGVPATAQSCGGSLQGEQGNISSPNYPSDYPNDITCTWNIEVPAGNAIEITFPADSFLQYSGGCYSDSLTFNDVYRNPPYQYRGLCGYIASGTKIVTSSRRLKVVLTTDRGDTNYGFLFEWKAFQTACGEVFTGESGTITTPNYPSLYPEQINCKWTIQVAEGEIIEVLFPDKFTIEYGYGCRSIYLKLKDEYANPPVTYATLCGTYPAGTRIATSSSNLDVIFNTDRSQNHPGLSIQWRAVSTLCGETFTGTSGTLSSPFYPLEYPTRLTCRWYIEVPADRTIEVVFPAEASIEYTSSCYRDKLQFIDGLSYPATTYATLCGKIEAGYTISTTTSKLEIVFTTNDAVAFDGWLLNWREISCDEGTNPQMTYTCQTVSCESVTESDCKTCSFIRETCCEKCQAYFTSPASFSETLIDSIIDDRPNNTFKQVPSTATTPTTGSITTTSQATTSTQAPTTTGPSNPVQTAPGLTTPGPITPSSTTPGPTTLHSTISSPAIPNPTTPRPTTIEPTTPGTTSFDPTASGPTTTTSHPIGPTPDTAITALQTNSPTPKVVSGANICHFCISVISLTLTLLVMREI